MIKKKTFTADIHAYSIGGQLLPFYNTNTNSQVKTKGTNHVLTFQAKDKQEFRRRIAKGVRELQSHLVYGEDYTYYINHIWEK